MRGLAALLIVLGACGPETGPVPNSNPCEDNTAPFLGNFTMEGFCTVGEGGADCLSEEGELALLLGEAEKLWSLSMTVQYADPGVDGAGDAPNMVGGLISGETTVFQFPSVWLYDATVDSYAAEAPYSPILDPTATQGVIDIGTYIPDVEMDYFSPITVNVRVRDACDAVSNEVSCRYLMGTGEWIDCQPPAPPAEQ